MATFTETFPDVHLSTDAGFRTYVEHVQDLILTPNPSVLTLASDTGQIDIVTVSSPAASGTGEFWASTFNIFEFDDGTLNLFIKVEYGVAKNVSGTATTDLGQPLLRVSVGTGSNGSGSLTGQFINQVKLIDRINHSIATSRGIHESYCCVRDGFFALCVNVGGSGGTYADYPNDTYNTTALNFIISREPSKKNFVMLINRTGVGGTSDDTDTARRRDLTIGRYDMEFPARNNTYETSNYVARSIMNPSLSFNTGADTFVRRLDIASNTGVYQDPNIVLYYQGDFATASTSTFTLDATSKTFLFLTPALRCKFPYKTNVAIRWD